MCINRICCGDTTMFGCCPGNNDAIFKLDGFWTIKRTDIKCFYSVCGAYWCCRGLTTLCNIVAFISITGMMIVYTPLLLLDKCCCNNNMQVYNECCVEDYHKQVELFDDIFCLTDSLHPCSSQYVFFRSCCCCCVKKNSFEPIQIPINSQPLEVVSSGAPAETVGSPDDEIPPPYDYKHQYVPTNFTGFTKSINESESNV
jgi:hypothetical protein